MIFVFWWYVNHLWCNLNTLGPLTKIWIFLPFQPVRLPWQPDLCAEMLVLGHIWGAKSEKLKKVLENFFSGLKVFHGIHPGAISQRVMMNLIHNMCSEITHLKLETDFRDTNELTNVLARILYVVKGSGPGPSDQNTHNIGGLKQKETLLQCIEPLTCNSLPNYSRTHQTFWQIWQVILKNQRL